MVFVSRLPLSSIKNGSVWVIVDPNRVRPFYSSSERLLPVKKKLYEALGSRLDFSTTFHPQIDGQSERSSIQMAPYKVLYGRTCHTALCWTKLGERWILCPELVSETKDKVRLIWDHLKVASDRKKSYADLKRRDIKYVAGDFLELPSKLDRIHDVFHVSMLRRYRFDPSYIVSVEEIEVRPDLTFEVESIQILERDIKVLSRMSIPLVRFCGEIMGGNVYVEEVFCMATLHFYSGSMTT
ncbi:uncharacterized protein LOC128040472 [Gossypium raimondii]|uniref:uncharacterized protein LOC128040472 n=1 Tax=Gossypium raimondii TaxID=29730 RepID=UPI00227AA746|nr:uncharacterized protein LOC128040472 [Gossypium raimondii]